MKDIVQLATYVEKSVADRLTVKAEELGVSSAEILRRALRLWFGQDGKELDTKLDEAQTVIDDLRSIREYLRKFAG